MKKHPLARWVCILRSAAPAAVAGCVCLTACSRNPAALSVVCSTSFEPVAEQLAEAFSTRHPGTPVTIHPMDSASGLRAMLEGVPQMGITDYAVLPGHASSLLRREIARDGIAVIVHPSNAATNLSTEQIRLIFGGRLRNWREVGGNDAPIDVVSREVGSGTREAFEHLLGGVSNNADTVVQETSRAVLETVANDRNAIGYLSLHMLEPKVRSLPVNGINCDAEAIAQGRYTLARPIVVLSRGEPSGTAAGFLTFMLSTEGQALLSSKGLVPACRSSSSP